MSYTLLGKIKRAVRKPPSYIVKRLWIEASRQLERKRAPLRASRFNTGDLLEVTQSDSIKQLWEKLAHQPYFADCQPREREELETYCAGATQRIMQEAQQALNHQVNLLGSGLVDLGVVIDWQQDYKTGRRWAPQYCHDIEYNNLTESSDVKFPWEVSRLQWAIPLGQAYLLTHDERYAVAVKIILLDWIKQNPYATSVNWACTMDVALRLISWSWFFHVFKNASCWQDEAFQATFLKAFYLHGDFTSRNLEESDVNGNHYTTDAVGLVFAGLFFMASKQAQAWLEQGWKILREEIMLQVSDDGVNFEASIPYHRLVFELFLFAALYRQAYGLSIDVAYQDRLIKMAYYTAAYSRPDGSVPLLGDADDGRVLPFRLHPINDHRYLIGLTGLAFAPQALLAQFSGPLDEIYWLMGADSCKQLQLVATEPAFAHQNFKPGYYIMRNNVDHIFIDGAEVGMGGKGGHGHNDCSAFTAMLNGELLIEDRGAYLYTADAYARNEFRATGSHNTPMIDEVEINRLVAWDFLWNLRYEAIPHLLKWHYDQGLSLWVGNHQGYQKLVDPVTLIRSIELNHHRHQLTIVDSFAAKQAHAIKVPLYLMWDVQITQKGDIFKLEKNGKTFILSWECKGAAFDSTTDLTEAATLMVADTSISPSYGVKIPSKKLVWSLKASSAQLKITLSAQ